MSGKRESLRVLVADDNPDSADSMAALLELHGHQVVTVYDGKAALTAALERVPDVAVLDIGMPYMNGFELASALRQQCSSTLLIAVSGWGSTKDVATALDAGFHHHMTKPAEFSAILSLLDPLSANDENAD